MWTWWYKTLAVLYGFVGKEKKVLVPYGCFASLLILKDNALRLLLVHHNYGDGLWSLPGGGQAYIGEPANKAAERELLEESGLKVKAIKLIALLSLRKSVGNVAFFKATLTGVDVNNIKIKPENPKEIANAGFFTWLQIQNMYRDGAIYKAQYQLAMLAFQEPKDTVYEWPMGLR